MPETRNVLVESARIARGDIKNISEIKVADFNGLVMPGGFGTAKNLTKWAFQGPEGPILPEIKTLILDFISAKKPIAALCMSPTTLAKALEGSGMHAKLTVGTTEGESTNQIADIAKGMKKIGAHPEMKTVHQVAVDYDLKIVTAPCYMMEANIVDVYENTKQAVAELIRLS